MRLVVHDDATGRILFDTAIDSEQFKSVRMAALGIRGDGRVATLHDGRQFSHQLLDELLAGLRVIDWSDNEAAFRRNVDELRGRYVYSDYAEGFPGEVVVADLIVRRLITDRTIAWGVMGWCVTCGNPRGH